MAVHIFSAACSTVCAVLSRPLLRCCASDNFPRSPEEITASWLTRMLQKQGLLDDSVAVNSVHAERIGEDEKGAQSDLVFLSMSFSGDPGECPRKMVAKFSLKDFTKRVIFKLTRMPAREIGFLGEVVLLAKEQQIRVPRMYFSCVDRGTQDFLILLEDLRERGAKSGVKLSGCSVNDAKRVLSVLAKLHAAFWGAGREIMPGIAPRWNDKDQAFVQLLIKDTWPKFMRWARALPGDSLAGIHEFEDCGLEVIRIKDAKLRGALATPPLTLVHGDSHCENFMFEPDGSVIALDFQLCMVGQAAFDVANFCVTSLTEKQYITHCAGLRDFYFSSLRERLAEFGKNDGLYSRAEFERRYVSGLVYTLLLEAAGVGTTGNVALAAVATERKLVASFSRLLSALRDARAAANGKRPSLVFDSPIVAAARSNSIASNAVAAET